MATTVSRTGFAQTTGSASGVFSFLERYWGALQRSRKREQLRTELCGLNDNELQDIGVVRGEIDYIVSNTTPFGKASEPIVDKSASTICTRGNRMGFANSSTHPADKSRFTVSIGNAPPGPMVTGSLPSQRSACVSVTRFEFEPSASARARIAEASASPRSLIASAWACVSVRTELARPVACVTAMSALIFSCCSSCWRCWTATSACMRASTERI